MLILAWHGMTKLSQVSCIHFLSSRNSTASCQYSHKTRMTRIRNGLYVRIYCVLQLQVGGHYEYIWPSQRISIKWASFSDMSKFFGRQKKENMQKWKRYNVSGVFCGINFSRVKQLSFQTGKCNLFWVRLPLWLRMVIGGWCTDKDSIWWRVTFKYIRLYIFSDQNRSGDIERK